MCTRCYEYTSILEPCCNASVDFEGEQICAEDVISDIAYDLGISVDAVQELLDQVEA